MIARKLAAALALGAVVLSGNVAAAERQATIYKHPQCGCCTGHGDYLKNHGFDVKIVATEAIDQVKNMAGIPDSLHSCHTTMIDGYVVEGHVPAPVIDKLLSERPKIKGIALPGMPQGSPGMSGDKEGPFTVYTIETSPQVFAVD